MAKLTYHLSGSSETTANADRRFDNDKVSLAEKLQKARVSTKIGIADATWIGQYNKLSQGTGLIREGIGSLTIVIAYLFNLGTFI